MLYPVPARGPAAFGLRLFAWGTVTVAFAFLFENWLVHWRGLPGAGDVLTSGEGVLAALIYLLAALLALGLAWRGAAGTLRDDSDRIAGLVAWMVRGAFFAVLLIGLVDVLITFLRVEGYLRPLVGDAMADQLRQSSWRGPNVHMPLAALGFVIAFFTRTLGFIWLALLVVAAQLVLVIGRFVFSYEQPFMSDLVRLWYASLFLFASAYTLVEEGHVRVDVFYSTMSLRGRALVNGIGSVVLGMSMCWTILILGTATSASTLIGPFLRYEQGPQTYALMTKYLLAVALGVFAVTMLLQFASYVLKAAADWRGEPDPDARPEGQTLAAAE
ncbi:MAG: TRAP transporter small permease subunit [Alkalilacustris sp.]